MTKVGYIKGQIYLNNRIVFLGINSITAKESKGEDKFI